MISNFQKKKVLLAPNSEPSSITHRNWNITNSVLGMKALRRLTSLTPCLKNLFQDVSQQDDSINQDRKTQDPKHSESNPERGGDPRKMVCCEH